VPPAKGGGMEVSMEIYTSSYWKYRGARGVQISVSKPSDSVIYKKLVELSPSWEMVNSWNQVKDLPDESPIKNKAWEEYSDKYWIQLNTLGAEHVLSLLVDGDVLLCWCGKRKWCHRSIFAEWLELNGIHVKELP